MVSSRRQVPAQRVPAPAPVPATTWLGLYCR